MAGALAAPTSWLLGPLLASTGAAAAGTRQRRFGAQHFDLHHAWRYALQCRTRQPARRLALASGNWRAPGCSTRSPRPGLASSFADLSPDW